MLRLRLVSFALLSLTYLAAQSAASPAPSPAQAQAPVELTADQVLAHLNEVIDWYRRTATLEQTPALADDAVARDRLHQTSVTALRLAFEFGRAAAALVSAGPDDNAQSDDSDQSSNSDDPARLERAAARLGARVTNLQTQLSQLDAQLAHAPADQRSTLVAQRAQIAASLSLAREVQDTVRNLVKFAATSMASGAGGGTGLLAQVNSLERTVPEARQNASSTASSTAAAPAASGSAPTASSGATAEPPFRFESAGLIALATEWFTLRSARRQLDDAIDGTITVSKTIDTLRGGLTKQVRALLKGALSGNTATSTDPAQLASTRRDLESATARFKRLSTLLVPLGEEDITMDNARGVLSERRATLRAHSTAVVRHLALRVGALLASIAFIATVSAVWRRATFRYLHDARRRRQFLALRRVATGVALTLVILMAFLSEVGSLATYVGFLTAGLAVALQNVILAVVAYFFLIGRYGVRVGDRITLANVTGRVVDIGLVRIYLMELAGPGLHSTGRMIVLSNAVLFQPSALFKQIPGADYVWHTISLTLVSTADLQEAQSRLKAAADAVYEKYRPSIERQFAATQRLVDFDSAPPGPEIHVRFSESGLEFSVRYPVEPEHAASIDQNMARALHEALERDPQLTPVASGAPSLKASTT